MDSEKPWERPTSPVNGEPSLWDAHRIYTEARSGGRELVQNWQLPNGFYLRDGQFTAVDYETAIEVHRKTFAEEAEHFKFHYVKVDPDLLEPLEPFDYSVVAKEALVIVMIVPAHLFFRGEEVLAHRRLRDESVFSAMPSVTGCLESLPGTVRDKVNISPSGCWIWMGSINRAGYGTVRREKRNQAAHRYIFELEGGELSDGILLRHKCNIRQCVNPEHMMLGNQLLNSMDAMQSGRMRDAGIERERLGVSIPRLFGGIGSEKRIQIRRCVKTGDLTVRKIYSRYKVEYQQAKVLVQDALDLKEVADIRSSFFLRRLSESQLAHKYCISQRLVSALIDYRVCMVNHDDF